MFSEKVFNSPNVYHSSALEKSAVVKTGAAKLLGLIAETTTDACWIQIHDAAALPSNGAVPIVSLKVATAGQVSLDLGSVNCIPCASGIVVACSSTGPTLTISATDNTFFTAFSI